MKIILDFDGTLATSLDLCIEAFRAAHDKYKFHYIEDHEIQTLRHYNVLQILKHIDLPIYRVPALTRFVRNYMTTNIKTLSLASNWNHTLKELSLHHELIILSSNSKNNIQDFLKQHDLTCFKDVVSNVAVFGKAKVIQKIIRDNHWNKENVFYIGDEIRDVKAAKKCKINSVAVTWGYNSEESLIKSQPDHLISDSNALINIMES